MAWTYLAASGGSQSPSTNGLDQSHIAKSTPIVREYCSLKWLTNHYIRRPYAPILNPSEDLILMDLTSISSSEDFHARTLALQDLEKAWKESEADYFSRSCVWPKKSSPSSYFLKTSQPFRVEEAFE